MGFVEQSSSRSPRTFLGAFGRPPPFPVSSLSTADLWVAATFPIPATACRRQWAPERVLRVAESTQALVAAAHVSNRRLEQDKISARLARVDPDNRVTLCGERKTFQLAIQIVEPPRINERRGATTRREIIEPRNCGGLVTEQMEIRMTSRPRATRGTGSYRSSAWPTPREGWRLFSPSRLSGVRRRRTLKRL